MKYVTASGEIVSLNPRKFAQRKRICEKITNRYGTILELFAGRGYLTEKLYSKFCVKGILVEKKNYDELTRFKSRRYTIFIKNNEKFLKEDLNRLDLNDMTLIDFDAFGTPIPAIHIFFRNFKVTKPFFLTLTDATARYIQMNYNRVKELTKVFLDNGYDFVYKRIETRLLVKNTITKTLENIAKKYDFKINYLNYANNSHTTIYMGFEVLP